LHAAAEKSNASPIAAAVDPPRRLRMLIASQKRKLAHLADAIVQSHLLLLPTRANGRAQSADTL
jgi:hypothetical protein